MREDLEHELHCPSAQPDMREAQILGVVRGDTEAPRIAYMRDRIPATADVLAQAGPALPGEIFRLAARCEQSKCTHFSGGRCQLAARIVDLLPEVADNLPPCLIRKTCRWYYQEGRAACLRCPQIVTAHREVDEVMRSVAGAPRAAAPAQQV